MYSAEQIAVELPGGLFAGNKLCRQALLEPLTGSLEARIAEIAERKLPDLQRITETLGCAVRLGADRKKDSGLVEHLCLGDRQYLMLCLAWLMGGDRVWIHVRCRRCANLFDLQLQRSRVPVKFGGDGYPFAEVNIQGMLLRFRVPNGIDELHIRKQSVDRAVHTLLVRCFIPNHAQDDVEDVISKLKPDDIARIDQALDEIAPDVGSQVETACPECAGRQLVDINIAETPEVSLAGLYRDIHTLAQSYGWTESEILSLPSQRRKIYIRLVDQTRGIYA